MSSMSDEKRPAVLQLPGSGAQDGKRSVRCEVECMQGKRLTISTPEYIGESSIVSVEYEDTLLLGEVISCSRAQEVWSTVIHVEQILTGLQSLMALRAHLMSESLSAAPQVLVPVGMRE